MTSREAVRALVIGPEVESQPLEFTGTATGAVVSGSIVALDGSVSEQHQMDVLQCMLLATLAASAKADRHKDPLNWYKIYEQTLASIGWVVQTSTTMSRYLPPGIRFSIFNVISDLFRPKIAPEEFSIITETLNSFKRDSSGASQFMFECPSHSGGIGNFQFGMATEEGGNVSLQLGRFTFTTAAQVTRLAAEEFPMDATFKNGFTALTLDEQVYRSVRTAVASKVASRFSGSVAQLELRAG
jgi:hypothetical protein